MKPSRAPVCCKENFQKEFSEEYPIPIYFKSTYAKIKAIFSTLKQKGKKKCGFLEGENEKEI